MKIGGRSGVADLQGWIDEPRVSRVARWTESFSPPTEPYTYNP